MAENEEKSYVNKIHDCIHIHRRDFWGMTPHYIILHYDDFAKLRNDFAENYGLWMDTKSDGRHYFEGIPIIRTSDIPRGEMYFGYNDIQRMLKLK